MEIFSESQNENIDLKNILERGFSSFPGAPTPTITEEDSSISSDTEEEIKSGKKRKRKSKKEKKHKKKKTDKEKIVQLELQKKLNEEHRIPTSVWLTSENEEKLYWYDYKGDPNNILFGSLYRSDIPIYEGNRFCLGLKKGEVLKWTKSGYIVTNDTISSKKYRYSASKNAIKDKDEESDIVLTKTKEFNEKLQENPNDIELWKNFINYQDQLLNLGKKYSKAGVIEKKLSIYRKALESNPNSTELLLGMLQEGSILWDSEKTLSMWKRVMKENEHNPDLWKEYILYLQTSFSSFSVSSMRQTYIDAIQTLHSIVRQMFLSKNATNVRSLELSLLDIFVISCNFEKQSGHIERAIGYYQALLEFNFFFPVNVFSFKEHLKLFETFWDSESPRIGDQGCIGWCNSLQTFSTDQQKQTKIFKMNSSLQTEPILPTVPRPAVNPSSKEEAEDQKLIQDWLNEEEEKDATQWQPARPTLGFGVSSDNEIEDPERIILFEDLKNYLFQFTALEIKIELVFRFLEFLGVNVPPRVCSNDPYLQQKAQDIEDLNSVFEVLVNKNTTIIENKISDPTKIEFIRNVFNLIGKVLSNNNILLIAQLNFEKQYNVNNARSVAKTILSFNRSDLKLWNTYSQIELASGNSEKARQVYATALSLLQSIDPIHQLDAPLLFRYFAQLEMQQSNPSKALHILASCVENTPFQLPKTNEPPNATRILKSRKSYEQKFSTLPPTSSSIHFVVCYALFEMLTVGIDSACTIFQQALSKYKANSLDHEELTTAFVHFLFNRPSDQIYAPYKIRQVLYRAMETYPTNTYYLAMFIEGEMKSQIAGRIRTYFDEVLEKYPIPILWLFAIHTETTRLGASNRIRVLFDKAIDHPKSRLCIGIWRYYLRYELNRGSTDIAKGVFYQAIRYVPWSKALWMDSIRFLHSFISRDEFHDILKLMSEKEIRIRKLPGEQ